MDFQAYIVGINIGSKWNEITGYDCQQRSESRVASSIAFFFCWQEIFRVSLVFSSLEKAELTEQLLLNFSLVSGISFAGYQTQTLQLEVVFFVFSK